jgi:flagellar basal-body rod protein FlgF
MDGIDLMASAMRAAKARLDASAGNLANVSTDGFRRSVVHVELSARGLETHCGVSSAPGPLRHTGRTLDLAVAGEGAFFVRGPSGVLEAQRSASLSRDGAGRLVDERGRALSGAGGEVHASASASIAADGRIIEGGRTVARLQVAPGTSLQAGFLETSNVNAVSEMVEVLAAQRSFETAQQTLSAIDNVRSKAVNDVVRVPA